MSNPENGGNGSYKIGVREVYQELKATRTEMAELRGEVAVLRTVLASPETGGVVKLINEHEARLGGHDKDIGNLKIGIRGTGTGILIALAGIARMSGLGS